MSGIPSGDGRTDAAGDHIEPDDDDDACSTVRGRPCGGEQAAQGAAADAAEDASEMKMAAMRQSIRPDMA